MKHDREGYLGRVREHLLRGVGLASILSASLTAQDLTHLSRTSFDAAGPGAASEIEDFSSYTGTGIVDIEDELFGGLVQGVTNLGVFSGGWMGCPGFLDHALIDADCLSGGDTITLAFARPVFGVGGDVFDDQNSSVIRMQAVTAAGNTITLDDPLSPPGCVGFMGITSTDGIIEVSFINMPQSGGTCTEIDQLTIRRQAIGTVVGTQKISATAGGFMEALDDGDSFQAAVGIGDLDGDGIVELAVGAHADDDGGPDRGAVHILFMNADGTVRDSQKISATQGGFVGPLLDRHWFGVDVTPLGDLNGDRIPDIAVGSYGVASGAGSEGDIWILLLNRDGTVASEQRIGDGIAGFNSIQEADRFGNSLACIGDLDQDGVVDLAVGALGDDGNFNGTGAVWIVFLNTDGSPSDRVKIDDGALPFVLDQFDAFGGSVAGIGDLNGDGVPDLAVGARGDDDGGTVGSDRGAVYVLFLTTTANVTGFTKISDTQGGFTSPLSDGDQMGEVEAPGDLDGDGIFDLLIAAPDHDDGGNSTGAVWVSFLNSDGTIREQSRISETSGGFGVTLDPGDAFGTRPGLIGDLNRDGTLEVAIGAAGDDDGGSSGSSSDVGAVYLTSLHAPATFEVVGHQKISDTQGGLSLALPDGDRWGSELAPIGDLDGDGIPDAVVSSRWEDAGGPDRGAIYVLFLNPDGTVKSEQKIAEGVGGFSEPLGNFDYFGNGVEPLGDLDGDGVLDLAVGASNHNTGGSVFILFMNADGTVDSWQEIDYLTVGTVGFARFGWSIAFLGDLAGDGYYELAVGQFLEDTGGPNRGAVWVVSFDVDTSGPSPVVTVRQVPPPVKIAEGTGGFSGSLNDEDRFGGVVVALGDLDGDGICDLGVATPEDDDGGTAGGASNVGASWILFLNGDGTVKDQQKISGISGGFEGELEDGDAFTISSLLGDANGDGVQDLLFSASGDDDLGTDRGAFWVLYMNPDGTVLDERKMSPSVCGLALDDGDVVAGRIEVLGDVNGDGFADLLLTAGGDDDGGSDTGAVYVLFSRGLVGGAPQTIWTGSQGTDWHDPDNWSGGVPTAFLGALVPTNPVGGAVFPDTGTPVAECLSLALVSGASLQLGTALELSGGASFDGSVSGAGELRFLGSGTVMASTPLTAPSLVQVNASGTICFGGASLSLSALQLDGGALEVAGGNVTSVSGASGFSGGTLSGAGELDLNGDVTFDGASGASPPTLRLSANLSTDGSFVPTAGTTVFDGITVIDNPGGSLAFFADVTVEPLAAVMSDEMLMVSGGFDLQSTGMLDLSVGAGTGLLDVDGPATGGGTMNLGSSGGKFGGNFLFGGPLSSNGMILFNSTGDQTVDTPTTFPVGVEVLVGSELTVLNTLDVDGDFRLMGGNVLVDTGSTLDVLQNADLDGGNLSDGQGLITIAGDLTLNGTTASQPPSIALQGNLMATVSNAFAPVEDVITFNGSGPQTIAGLNLSFNNFTVSSNLTVLNDLTVMNNLTIGPMSSLTTNAALLVGGDVSGPGSGTLNLGTSGGNLGGGLLFDGTLSSAGMLVFYEGSQSSRVVDSGSPGPLPTVVVTGGGTLTFLQVPPIAGDLEHLGGTLAVDTAVTVSGDATFNGAAELQGTGLLDVEGDVTFSGTSVSTPPVILCAGSSWTADGLFAPISSSVVLDGVGSQTVSANQFFDLTVASTSTVTNLSSLNAGGGLSVAGTFQTTTPLVVAGVLDVLTSAGLTTSSSVTVGTALIVAGTMGTPTQLAVTGDTTVATTGCLTLGAGPHSFGGNLTVNGAIKQSGTESVVGADYLSVGGDLTVGSSLDAGVGTLAVGGALSVPVAGVLTLGAGTHSFGPGFDVQGTLAYPPGATTFRFTGSGTIPSLPPPGEELPAVILDGVGPFVLAQAEPLTIDGDLTVVSGQVDVMGSTTVNGNASLSSGSWGSGTGPLSVSGDVTFLGFAVTGAPVIDAGGAWTSDAAFAPTGGTVTLSGPGTLGADMPGAATAFWDLVLASGVHAAADDISMSVSSIEVQPAAELDVGTRRLAVTGGPIDVDGTLAVGTDGELALGPAVAVTVNPGGTLRLVSTAPPLRARVVGENGGGYAFDVHGNVEGMNFEFSEMGAAGIRVDAAAVFAAPPMDFRGAHFSRPRSGGVLLELERAFPTDVRYANFKNPGQVLASNVRVPATSAPITLTNWDGDFASEVNEDDPGALLDWLPEDVTQLAFLRTKQRSQGVELTWRTLGGLEVDNDAYVVERAIGAGGSYVTIGELPGAGAQPYLFFDPDAPAGKLYRYRLQERLTHLELRELGTGQAWTPFVRRDAQVVSMTVGASGDHPTLARALEAGSLLAGDDHGLVLWVEPGTYAAFTLGAEGPRHVHLIAEVPGTVRIDASGEPLRVQGLAAERSVQLRGVRLDAGSSRRTALVVEDSDGLVLLDEVAIEGGVALIAARANALQRTSVTGSLALDDDARALVVLGDLGSADVAGGSLLETAGAEPGDVRVVQGSRHERLAAPPGLEVEATSGLATLVLEMPVGASWWMLVASELAWGALRGPDVALPLLVASTELHRPSVGSRETSAAGERLTVELELPPGSPDSMLAFQALVHDPLEGTWSLSNVATLLATRSSAEEPEPAVNRPAER